MLFISSLPSQSLDALLMAGHKGAWSKRERYLGLCSVIFHWQKGEVIVLEKNVEENSNYENRKYTHEREHYCTGR